MKAVNALKMYLMDLQIAQNFWRFINLLIIIPYWYFSTQRMPGQSQTILPDVILHCKACISPPHFSSLE